MDYISNVTEEVPEQQVTFHPAVRIVAKVVSFVFHPLFIPVYISWFLIYISPIFPAYNPHQKLLLLTRFFVMYTMFPLVTVLLAKGLGFLQSIYLKTQRDRIIPYVACGMYYFWMWYVLRNQAETVPAALVMLSLAIFIASSIGLIANSYLKVSMHAISVGVLITFAILLGFSIDASLGAYISIALLIAGLVCTARLITGDHYVIEVYLGLFIGIISQVVAYLITI